MEDPVFVASGVARLSNIADLVFSRTDEFVKAANGAESSIQTLAIKIRTLAGLLRSLLLLTIELEMNPTESAFRLQHVISCQQVLLEIERRTSEANPSNSGDNEPRAIARILKWPFSPEETMSLIAEISRHQRLFIVALSADSITRLQQLLPGQDDLYQGFKDIQDEFDWGMGFAKRITRNARREMVVKSIRSVDPAVNHEASKDLGHHETCPRLLAHWKLLEWNNNQDPTHFYWNCKDEQYQKVSNILGTIACQMARKDASQRCFGILQDYLYESRHLRDKPTPKTKATRLLDLIKDMSSSFHKTSIFTGALDVHGCDGGKVVEGLASLDENVLSNIQTAFLSGDNLNIKVILEAVIYSLIAAHNDDPKIFFAGKMKARVRRRRLHIEGPEVENEITEKSIHCAEGV